MAACRHCFYWTHPAARCASIIIWIPYHPKPKHTEENSHHRSSKMIIKWSSNDHQMITFYINSDTLYKTHHHDLQRPRDLRKWCCRACSGANRSEGSGTKHPLRRCTNSFNLTSCGESPQGLRRKTISWKCVLFLLMISCKFVGFPMSRCFRRVFVGDIQESNHLNQMI